MKLLALTLALLVAWTAIPATAKTYDVLIYNACPQAVSLTLYLNGRASHYKVESGKPLKLRNAHNSRALQFKAWGGMQDTDAWIGRQVERKANSRFAYTDTWAAVDFDLCDSPNNFPWFLSIDNGGDTVYPAFCTKSAAHFRLLNIHHIGRYTWCPKDSSWWIGTPRSTEPPNRRR